MQYNNCNPKSVVFFMKENMKMEREKSINHSTFSPVTPLIDTSATLKALCA